jgi:hypothetical protein
MRERLTTHRGPRGRPSFSAFLAAARLATDEAAAGSSGIGSEPPADYRTDHAVHY